jgi:serine/threonine-protein kinase
MAFKTLSSPHKLASLEYRVVRAVGAGAGSTIFLVVDAATSNRFALKVVKRHSPEDDIYVNQAVHEHEVTQRLNHPCLLKIHDIRVKRRWFKVEGAELLMEFVDGRNLDEVQRRPLGQLVLVFAQVASGLQHMHRRGIYHGDLKPSNVMLSRTGQVKIIDFGTAWVRGEPKDRVQGTPQYMAPEQAHDRVVDDRTDIYNFGATMYRMVTGQYANLDVPGMAIPGMNRRGRVTPIQVHPEMPRSLNELILRCLDDSPSKRPRDVDEIRDGLLDSARGLGVGDDELRGSEESFSGSSG